MWPSAGFAAQHPRLGQKPSKDKPSRRRSDVRFSCSGSTPTKPGIDVLNALAKRYELSAVGDDGLRVRVMVDDAVYLNEAVVRLASVLDEIDTGWEDHFGWPKSVGHADSGD